MSPLFLVRGTASKRPAPEIHDRLAVICDECGAEVPADAFSCPECGRVELDGERQRIYGAPDSGAPSSGCPGCGHPLWDHGERGCFLPGCACMKSPTELRWMVEAGLCQTKDKRKENAMKNTASQSRITSVLNKTRAVQDLDAAALGARERLAAYLTTGEWYAQLDSDVVDLEEIAGVVMENRPGRECPSCGGLNTKNRGGTDPPGSLVCTDCNRIFYDTDSGFAPGSASDKAGRYISNGLELCESCGAEMLPPIQHVDGVVSSECPQCRKARRETKNAIETDVCKCGCQYRDHEDFSGPCVSCPDCKKFEKREHINDLNPKCAECGHAQGQHDGLHGKCFASEPPHDGPYCPCKHFEYPRGAASQENVGADEGYAWRCRECGHKFASAAAAEKAVSGDRGCPKCGGVDVDESLPIKNSGGADAAIAAFEAHCEVCKDCKKVMNLEDGNTERDASKLCPDGKDLLHKKVENARGTPEVARVQEIMAAKKAAESSVAAARATGDNAKIVEALKALSAAQRAEITAFGGDIAKLPQENAILPEGKTRMGHCDYCDEKDYVKTTRLPGQGDANIWLCDKCLRERNAANASTVHGGIKKNVGAADAQRAWETGGNVVRTTMLRLAGFMESLATKKWSELEPWMQDMMQEHGKVNSNAGGICSSCGAAAVKELGQVAGMRHSRCGQCGMDQHEEKNAGSDICATCRKERSVHRDDGKDPGPGICKDFMYSDVSPFVVKNALVCASCGKGNNILKRVLAQGVIALMCGACAKEDGVIDEWRAAPQENSNALGVCADCLHGMGEHDEMGCMKDGCSCAALGLGKREMKAEMLTSGDLANASPLPIVLHGDAYELEIMDSSHAKMRLSGTDKWGILQHVAQLPQGVMAQLEAMGRANGNFLNENTNDRTPRGGITGFVVVKSDDGTWDVYQHGPNLSPSGELVKSGFPAETAARVWAAQRGALVNASWSEDMAGAYSAGLADAKAGRPRDKAKAGGFDAAYEQGYSHGENRNTIDMAKADAMARVIYGKVYRELPDDGVEQDYVAGLVSQGVRPEEMANAGRVVCEVCGGRLAQVRASLQGESARGGEKSLCQDCLAEAHRGGLVLSEKPLGNAGQESLGFQQDARTTTAGAAHKEEINAEKEWWCLTCGKGITAADREPGGKCEKHQTHLVEENISPEFQAELKKETAEHPDLSLQVIWQIASDHLKEKLRRIRTPEAMAAKGYNSADGKRTQDLAFLCKDYPYGTNDKEEAQAHMRDTKHAIGPRPENTSDRAHTPIVSEKQAGFFGAELGRLRAGKATESGMSEAELVRHLKEWGGNSNTDAPFLAEDKEAAGNAIYGSEDNVMSNDVRE